VNNPLSNKKILLTLIGNSVDIAIGFGTVMLVTWTYPETVAGQWFLFVTIFSLLNNLRDGFIQNGLIKYAQTEDPAARKRVYKTSLVVTLLFELSTSFVVFSLFRVYNWFGLAELFAYYPVYSIPYALYRWSFVLHRSQLNVLRTNFMNALFLLILGIGATYIYLTHQELFSLVILLGISSLFAAIVGCYPLGLGSILLTPFDRVIFRNITYYGKHGLLRELTGTLSTRISLFITAALLSYTQTAFLGVSQRYLTLLLIPNNAFQALLYPVLVRVSQKSSPQELKLLFEDQVSKLLAAMLFLAAVISIASPFLINVLHGADYQPSIGLLVISIWTLAVFTPFGSAFGSIINTIGKPGINSTIVMVNSCINIVLSYFLISWIGLYGAVLAPLLTELFGFIWARKIVSRHTKISYTTIFEKVPNHYKDIFSKIRLHATS
jgi:O-antigen/teichoic acid export membrane protein